MTTLSGSVGPGRYYLVELASGGTAGAALPAPDATGTTNLAASGGKVALVHGAAALTCGASAGSCASAVGLEDLVGYGSAADFEGAAAAPALDSTHAAARGASGCTDTGSNADDFTAATPAPRTTSSAAAACGGGTTTHPTLTATATVSADVQSALTISVDQPALTFGPVLAGTAPTRLPEHVTVVSNVATGYSLGVHRTVFSPADLPLVLRATAPAGATIGGSLQGGALAPIPVPPAVDLVLGTTGGPTSGAGDVWSTELGFAPAIPTVAPGHYVSTVTFTVIGR